MSKVKRYSTWKNMKFNYISFPSFISQINYLNFFFFLQNSILGAKNDRNNISIFSNRFNKEIMNEYGGGKHGVLGNVLEH